LHPKIQHRFDKSEKLRNQVIDSLQVYSDSQLAFRPAYDAWSINQVLQHLMLSDKGVVLYLNKKLQNDSLPNAGIGAKVRTVMLKAFLRSPFKVKIPGPYVQPIQPMTFWDIIKEWNSTREELQKILGRLNESQLDWAIFKHPIAGYMNVFQLLDFMDYHVQHHRYQLKRIVAAKDFPTV
jgi:uncharacterized damage-inducible protein DinB